MCLCVRVVLLSMFIALAPLERCVIFSSGGVLTTTNCDTKMCISIFLSLECESKGAGARDICVQHLKIHTASSLFDCGCKCVQFGCCCCSSRFSNLANLISFFQNTIFEIDLSMFASSTVIVAIYFISMLFISI